MTSTGKIVERRCRRLARRLGYRFHKARQPDPSHPWFGRCMVTSPTGSVVFGFDGCGGCFGAFPEEAEKWLAAEIDRTQKSWADLWVGHASP